MRPEIGPQSLRTSADVRPHPGPLPKSRLPEVSIKAPIALVLMDHKWVPNGQGRLGPPFGPFALGLRPHGVVPQLASPPSPAQGNKGGFEWAHPGPTTPGETIDVTNLD
jgi:hypothetical protein